MIVPIKLSFKHNNNNKKIKQINGSPQIFKVLQLMYFCENQNNTFIQFAQLTGFIYEFSNINFFNSCNLCFRTDMLQMSGCMASSQLLH